MSKTTATQQFEAFNYHMRNLGFDTALKTGCLFNWTQRELNKWSTKELSILRYNLHEALREKDCQHTTMYGAVLARVNLVTTRRMLAWYDNKCQQELERRKNKGIEYQVTDKYKTVRRVNEN